MDLNFTIEKQVMKRTDTEVPVSDSSMYLRLCFTFSEEWTDLDKYCFFRVNHVNYPYPITDNMITVPAIFVSGKGLVFGVYGVDADYRITTNLLKVHFEDSFYDTEVIDIRNWLEKDIDVINEHLASLDELVEGKSDVGHIHDDRYYTESECDDRYFTKTDSDDRYYTKSDSDDRYYTKTDSDDRYYTKSQSNTRHYSKSETDDLLDLKVDKVDGKELSSNDFTDYYKNYIDGFDGDIEAFLELHKAEIEASIIEDVLAPYVEVLGKIELPDGSKKYGYILHRIIKEAMVIQTTGFGNITSTSVSLLGNDIKIDWGDGTVTDYENDSSLTHTYSDSELHTVRITGLQGFSEIVTPLGKAQSIILPNGLLRIGDNIFGVSTFESITVPPSIMSVGNHAFRGNKSLLSFEALNVETIGEAAFYTCSQLSSISLPNVQSIEADAFSSCTQLSSISLPNVQTIGNCVFERCSQLSSISLPNVQSIGGSAFLACANLETITLGETLTSIQSEAFRTGETLTINLNWATSESILNYSSNWGGTNTTINFTVPHGTLDSYLAKGYPSDKLIERG